MKQYDNLRILAFIGMPGTGKTQAVGYIAQKNYPKVIFSSAQATVDQVNHLAEAGQRRIIIDDVPEWTDYKLLKHEFPGCVKVVAVTAPTHLRHKRLAERLEQPLNEEESTTRDATYVETSTKSNIIAVADYYLQNDKENEQDFYAKIDALLAELQF